MKKLHLVPVYGQKSFYGKAIVLEYDNGEKALQSYETIVCKVTSSGRFVRLWDGYSATTARHIDSFRILCGLPGICKKEWDKMPVEV